MDFKDLDNWRKLGKIGVQYITESPEYLQELTLLDQSGAGLQLMENLLDPLIDVEADIRLGDGIEETTEPLYTRNGCRLRKLETQLGTLNLGIPTYCDGSSKTALFETALFEPDAQQSDRLFLPTMKLLAHASRPDTVAVFAEELCQLSLPDDILDDLVSDFAQVIHDFENRPLEQAYPYVLLAESLVHTKHTNGKPARVHLYLVVGLREDGVREVLSYRVTEEDPRFSRPQIFLELFERGLHGVHTLIAKSNIDSLKKRIPELAPSTWSKYNIHFMKDILAACKEQYGAKDAASDSKKLETNLKKDLEAMLGASSWKECLEQRDAILEKYGKTAPKAMEYLSENQTELVAAYLLPDALRKKMGNKQAIESVSTMLDLGWL